MPFFLGDKSEELLIELSVEEVLKPTSKLNRSKTPVCKLIVVLVGDTNF